MAIHTVSRSDKAALRFISVQVATLVMIGLLFLFTEVSGEVVAPLNQVSIIVYLICGLSIRVNHDPQAK